MCALESVDYLSGTSFSLSYSPGFSPAREGRVGWLRNGTLIPALTGGAETFGVFACPDAQGIREWA